MKKTLKTAIALILFLILCTSSVNAFQFNGNMEVPGFIVDGIIYKHSPGSTDVGRILRTFKIKKNVEVTDNGKIII